MAARSEDMAESDADLREMCAFDGDWGGTPWGDMLLALLDELAEAQAKVARVEALADEWLHLANYMRGVGARPVVPLAAVPDQVDHMAERLHAALADEQDINENAGGRL